MAAVVNRMVPELEQDTILLNRFPLFAPVSFVFEEALRRANACHIAAGTMSWDVPFPRAVDFIQRLGVTAIASLPLEPVLLHDMAKDAGLDPRRRVPHGQGRVLRRRRAAAGAAPRHRARLAGARRRDLRLQRNHADGCRLPARSPASERRPARVRSPRSGHPRAGPDRRTGCADHHQPRPRGHAARPLLHRRPRPHRPERVCVRPRRTGGRGVRPCRRRHTPTATARRRPTTCSMPPTSSPTGSARASSSSSARPRTLHLLVELEDTSAPRNREAERHLRERIGVPLVIDYLGHNEVLDRSALYRGPKIYKPSVDQRLARRGPQDDHHHGSAARVAEIRLAHADASRPPPVPQRPPSVAAAERRSLSGVTSVRLADAPW